MDVNLEDLALNLLKNNEVIFTSGKKLKLKSKFSSFKKEPFCKSEVAIAKAELDGQEAEIRVHIHPDLQKIKMSIDIAVLNNLSPIPVTMYLNCKIA
jgi:hypothetical protein